jgi:hypothetical protein
MSELTGMAVRVYDVHKAVVVAHFADAGIAEAVVAMLNERDVTND